MKKTSAVFTLLLTLIGCQTTEQALKEAGNNPLSTTQIERAIAGNTMVGTSQRGSDFTAIWHKNGKIRILVAGREDVGAWRVTKLNTICNKFLWIRSGAETCSRWYKLGKDEYQSVHLDGSERSKFTIIKGNPKNL